MGISYCIVEGYRRERYGADFTKFLTYADASRDESILHLNFYNDLHSLDENELNFFLEKYYHLNDKINKFIRYVESEWK
jgi:four helix bundle protein